MGLGFQMVIAMVPTIPLPNHSKTKLKSVRDLNSVIKAGYSNGQSNNVTVLMTQFKVL